MAISERSAPAAAFHHCRAMRRRQRAGFALGNRVRVCSGPMRGCFGLYAGMAPRDRVLILLQMLGGAREIELPKSDVLKIGTMGV